MAAERVLLQKVYTPIKQEPKVSQQENQRVRALNKKIDVQHEKDLEDFFVVMGDYEVEKRMYTNNQSTLFSMLIESFSKNPAAVATIDQLCDEDDCGSAAIRKMHHWLTSGTSVTIEEDQGAYLKLVTEVFKKNRKSTSCTNDAELGLALNSLDNDMQSWRNEFRVIRTKDNQNPEDEYMSVNDQVNLIKVLLPTSTEWRLILRDLAADKPKGKSYSMALEEVQCSIVALLDPNSQLEVYERTDGAGAGAGSNSNNTGVVSAVVNGVRRDYPTNTDNDTKWSGGTFWQNKNCKKCGASGHGAGWMQCPQWVPAKAKSSDSYNSNSNSNRNKGGKGGRGKGGGRGGYSNNSSGGGRGYKSKSPPLPRFQDGTIDKRNLKCYSCDKLGHLKDDRECPMYDQTQAGPHGRAAIKVAVADMYMRKGSQ